MKKIMPSNGSVGVQPSRSYEYIPCKRGCFSFTRPISLSTFILLLLPIFSISLFTATAHAALGDLLYKWGSKYHFQSPRSVAVDSGGNMYVAALNDNQPTIFVFDNAGSFLRKWGSQGTGDGQFNEVYGIALDSHGNIYVADSGNYRVQVFSSTGTFLRKWGSYGNNNGQFQAPYGIAVDSNDNIYVSDWGNASVQVFSSAGVFLRRIGLPYRAYGTGGITLDSNGNIYVEDQDGSGGKVIVFDKDGLFLYELGSSGHGVGQFYFPSGIAVDGSGTVYIADSDNQRVEVFSSTGSYLRTWNLQGGNFSAYYGIAVDSHGKVYIADTHYNVIQQFNNTGTLLNHWGPSNNNDGLFFYPSGIATDMLGNAYVADYGNNRIEVFGNDGTFLREWEMPYTGYRQFAAGQGIAVDGAGDVYATGFDSNAVYVFDGTGVLLRQWGSYGSGDGQFSYPMGIAVDGNGNVYVADSGNNRIQVFDSTGALLREWGSYGSGDGQLYFPTDIALDSSGNVYVADSYNFRIQVFSKTGAFLGKWGEYGAGDGQFGYFLRGIALDSSGNVLALDSGNNRVQVFSKTGKYLGQWGTYGSGDGQLLYPQGLVVAGSGSVFVTDTWNHRVQVFDGQLTDTLPPVTTAIVSCALGNNGWCVSDSVISLTATDAGSGVKEIRYSIDGSTEKIVPGSSASLTITAEGKSVVTYYAIDIAGNEETPHQSETIRIDKSHPTILASATPTANANGWNNTAVTVSFTCDDVISGIASCTQPTTVTTEGRNQTISGTAVDNAGLSTSTSTDLNIDKTPPTITASVSPSPNANGWYAADVTVTFKCSDTLSGIASCPSPVTITADGMGRVVSGAAMDRADNTATTAVILNIDKTPPSVFLSASPTLLWPPNHKMVDVVVGGSAVDSGSGVASVVITVTDEYGRYNMVVPGFGSTIQLEAWREGTDMDGRIYTITAVVTDKAGNQSTASTTVLVPHDMR